MTPQRNGAMSAIGIMNIVFGSFACVLGLMGLFKAGTIAAFGNPVMTTGMLGTVLTLGFLASAGCLLYGGLGVWKVAPFGRKFSFLGSCAILAITAVSIITSSFAINLMNVLGLVYCGFVVYMCMTPQWKQAFSGQGTMTSQSNNYSRDYRAAA